MAAPTGTNQLCAALKELGSGANLQGDEWEEHDGLVLFRGKVYVPLNAQLQHDIVEAHHDTPSDWTFVTVEDN